ncbi:MAG TPA: HAMP domain-containing sensor histidine kinase [Elusimicrobiota bacterium]|jgi:signal transduction histidine kinase|nr:HAMP domain-containing sensor histidine kinase [Elusimicrobiota bacterium]
MSASAGPDRRGIYFAFQGLLMAVLILLLVYGARSKETGSHMALVLSTFLASLAFLRIAPGRVLTNWWVQSGIFLCDILVAAVILHWTGTGSDLYLIYLLIIFGTALTRNLAQTFALTVAASLLYLAPLTFPRGGVAADEGYWLRLLFLWISASLLAILARDSGQARREEERKYQERIIQFERLATLGQMAGEVAHRIKAPLTTILVNAEVLSHRLAKSDRALKELEQIRDEVGRCKEILKSLLDLGRIEEMDFSPVDLRDPLRQALRSVSPQAERTGLRVIAPKAPQPVMTMGDTSLLFEAVLAVLQNAVEAGRQGGTIRVALAPFHRRRWWPAAQEARGFHEISVEDDGTGIAPADLEAVFRPFFTTKGSAGSGLGLSAALRILQKHNGGIEAFSEGRGRGARFVLRLPALDRRPRRRSAAASA